jgi:hypothetical protein
MVHVIHTHGLGVALKLSNSVILDPLPHKVGPRSS